MYNTYIESKLKITLTPRDQEVLATLDPDIVKYCTDRVLMRPDIQNKLAFIFATARQVRKEVNPYGTFIINGLTKTKIDSDQRQLSLDDEDQPMQETSYHEQDSGYSRQIMVSSSQTSKLSPQEQNEKLERAKLNYARYQEAARLYKERIEMRPIETKPFELVRNPDYVDRGDPKSSIQRCVERLKI